MDVYYICNKEKYCVKLGGCGGDMCNHTCDVHFARNDESVKIFNDFVKTFDISADEDGTIYAVEKEK